MKIGRSFGVMAVRLVKELLYDPIKRRLNRRKKRREAEEKIREVENAAKEEILKTAREKAAKDLAATQAEALKQKVARKKATTEARIAASGRFTQKLQSIAGGLKRKTARAEEAERRRLEQAEQQNEQRDALQTEDARFKSSWRKTNGLASFIAIIFVAISIGLTVLISYWFARWIMSIETVRELIDREYIGAITMLLAGVFIYLAWIFSPSLNLKKEIKAGHKGVACLFSGRLLSNLQEGLVLWLGSIVQVPFPPEVTQIPNPRIETSGETTPKDEGLEVDMQLRDTEGTDVTKMIIGQFFVTIDITWEPIDEMTLVRTLKLGSEDRVVEWSDNDGISYREKQYIERTFLMGPLKKMFRPYFARLNYFRDVCGENPDTTPEENIDPAELEKRQKQKREEDKNHGDINLLRAEAMKEMLKVLNSVTIPKCGIKVTNIYVKRVLPANDLTKTAVHGAAGEIGEKQQEKTDAKTQTEVADEYLRGEGVNPEDATDKQRRIARQQAAVTSRRASADAVFRNEMILEVVGAIAPALQGFFTWLNSKSSGKAAPADPQPSVQPPTPPTPTPEPVPQQTAETSLDEKIAALNRELAERKSAKEKGKGKDQGRRARKRRPQQ